MNVNVYIEKKNMSVCITCTVTSSSSLCWSESRTELEDTMPDRSWPPDLIILLIMAWSDDGFLSRSMGCHSNKHRINHDTQFWGTQRKYCCHLTFSSDFCPYILDLFQYLFLGRNLLKVCQMNIFMYRHAQENHTSQCDHYLYIELHLFWWNYNLAEHWHSNECEVGTVVSGTAAALLRFF